MIDVNALEAIWLGINSTTLVIVALNVRDTWLIYAATRLLNRQGDAYAGLRYGQARRGLIRDALRMVVQVFFIMAAIPGALQPGEARFEPPVLFLLVGVMVTAITSTLDRLDRQALTRFVESQVAKGVVRIEEKVDENIELTRAVGEKADAAYREANDVNKKIAAQGKRIVDLEDEG
jgi:hypothetical protein